MKFKKIITWGIVTVALFFLSIIPITLGAEEILHGVCVGTVIYLLSNKITNWILGSGDES